MTTFKGVGRPLRAMPVSAVVLGLGALLVWCSGEPEARVSEPVRRVSVAPFQSDSSRRDRLAQLLAESLAARLSGLPSLVARAGAASFGAAGDFTVRGELGGRDGRLVIAARLYGRRDDSTLWNATFWRRDSLTTELVGDLAAGLAEAIYGYLARGHAATTRGKP